MTTPPLVNYHNPLFHDIGPRDLAISRDFTAAEFKERRNRISKEIGPDAHLLLSSGPPNPSIHNYTDAKFYYLCGLDIQNAYLLMDGADGHTTAYLPSRDIMDVAPDDRVGHEDADYVQQKLDVEAVKPLDDLTEDIKRCKTRYLPFVELEGGGAGRHASKRCAQIREETVLDRAEPDRKRMMRVLEELVPGVKLEDATPIFDTLRTIKSEAEIELMRQTSQLNAVVMI